MAFSLKNMFRKKTAQRRGSWWSRLHVLWMTSLLVTTLLLSAIFIFSSVLFYRIQNDSVFVADGTEVVNEPSTIDRGELEEVVETIVVRRQVFEGAANTPVGIPAPN